jgi:uncharacterized protein YdeI (YjbR/CyaY-like superfamily)
MKNASPQVDAYIEESADFAKPVLVKLRKLVHKGCPVAEETIKWGNPYFVHKGMLAGMAAFKAHVGFSFWKGKLLSDPHGLFDGVGNTGMTAIKATDVSELPPDKVMLQYIREAVELNDADGKPKETKPKKKAAKLKVPDYFIAALKKNKKARATFESFSQSHRNEYVEWIVEAKQEATRTKRLGTAIEWMAEGKPRNWKYMKSWK